MEQSLSRRGINYLKLRINVFSAWHPLCQYDVAALENVLSRVTKSLSGHFHLTNEQRLRLPNGLSLADYKL